MTEIKKISCTINTPISEYISKEGDMIVLPAQEGEIGVLPLHMQLIAELKEGEIKIYSESQVIETIHTKGGVAYIKENGVEIFGQ